MGETHSGESASPSSASPSTASPSSGLPSSAPVRVVVNGAAHECEVDPRTLLSDFLRHDLGLTGTHVGCEHGVCGACTILLDGVAVRSCLMFAAQLDGHHIVTVEGLAPEAAQPDDPDGPLHPLQRAFWETHALQCGFCTPGILLTMVPFLEAHPDPTDAEIRSALGGNLCRCTGYQNLVAAVKLAARELATSPSEPSP